MAYDLEEQEQLDALRAFWKQYGNFILTAITVAALAVAAWRGWGWYQERKTAEAAVVYEQLRQAVSAKDLAQIRANAGTLFERHGSSAYGQMAAMVVSRAYIEAGEAKLAKVPLQWAIDNAQDEEFRHAARLRLAGILLDEKAFDEALKLLQVSTSGRYAGEYADRRGDVHAAAGRAAQAREAYREALERLTPTSPLRRLVEIKLQTLGTEGA